MRSRREGGEEGRNSVEGGGEKRGNQGLRDREEERGREKGRNKRMAWGVGEKDEVIASVEFEGKGQWPGGGGGGEGLGRGGCSVCCMMKFPVVS